MYEGRAVGLKVGNTVGLGLDVLGEVVGRLELGVVVEIEDVKVGIGVAAGIGERVIGIVGETIEGFVDGSRVNCNRVGSFVGCGLGLGCKGTTEEVGLDEKVGPSGSSEGVCDDSKVEVKDGAIDRGAIGFILDKTVGRLDDDVLVSGVGCVDRLTLGTNDGCFVS